MPSPAVRRILFGQSVPAWAVIRPLLIGLQMQPGVGSVTNTRATIATFGNEESVIKSAISGQSTHPGCRVVKNNLLVKTEDFTNGIWLKDVGGTGVAPVVTQNYGSITAPDGTFTACRLQLDRSAGGTFSRVQQTALSSAFTGKRVRSIYARTTDGSAQSVCFRAGVASTNIQPLINVTGTWQRFSVTSDYVAAVATFEIMSFTTAGGTQAVDILVWHPQEEDVTGQSNQNPGEYVSVGVLSAPYHGMNVDGVKGFATQNGNTVASNVVTEATGAAISASTLLGYRSEEARTNLVLRSQELGNAAWTQQNITISSDADVAPDGTTTADRLVETAVTSVHYNTTTAGMTISAGATVTASVYLKQGNLATTEIYVRNTGATRFAGIKFTYATGLTSAATAGPAGYTVSSSAVTTLPNGWYRVAVTIVTATDTSVFADIYAKDATSYLGVITNYSIAWGAQLEAGSFATSYIPTTTAAVTRNKTFDSIPTASNLLTINQTIYDEWTPAVTSGTQYIFGSYVDASNYTQLLHDGTSFIFRKRIGGVNYDASKTQALTAGTNYRLAARHHSGAGTDVFVNGSIGTSNADVTAMQISASLELSSDGNGTFTGGQHRNFRIANGAMSNTAIGAIA